MGHSAWVAGWFLVLAVTAEGAPPPPTREPLVRAIDLDRGESQAVTLCDGTRARVKLLALDEELDSVRDAVRWARVKLEVNGQPVELTSATYHLPKTVAGVQVDCTITRGYLTLTDQDHWGLTKAARLRLWPAGAPRIEPDKIV
jgi:hypothetical protein